jgi:LmbE family N-acetylglucosaminyl deacetylase
MGCERQLKDKHVLMVVAHCDDELVCGWPILQDPDIRKSLIIVSSDRNNSQRQWCSHRKFVAQDLCRSLGIPVRILDYDSEFYRLDHRRGHLVELEKSILQAIDKHTFDYLYTHNPHGEYGHLDHIFLSNLLYRAVDHPLLMSDITLRSNWTHIQAKAERYAKAVYRERIGTRQLDEAFYRRVLLFYETRGAWTWSQPPSSTAGLYLV